VDLTHAHPSGLAQLLSGRRTRLSTLLRDPVQYTQARRTARAISTMTADVAAQRGIDVGYLATGIVTWRTLRQGGNDFYSAPVMLSHVSMERRPGIDDEEIRLVGRSTPNPALLRHLRHTFGITLSAKDLLDSAYMTARFDPTGPLTLLRDALRDVAGLVVADRMVLATFADVADPADPGVVSPEHPVVSALMQAVGDDTVRPGRRSLRPSAAQQVPDAAGSARAGASLAAAGSGASAGERHGNADGAVADGADCADAGAATDDATAADDATGGKPQEKSGKGRGFRKLFGRDDSSAKGGAEETAVADAAEQDASEDEAAGDGASGDADGGESAAHDAAQGTAHGEASAGGEPTASGTETAAPAPAQLVPETLRDDVTTAGPDLRDPSAERLVLDADEDQYAVLDLIEHGRSVTVTAPAGTGATTLAVNAAARLAARGKRVLVVAEREQSVSDFLAELGRAGLDSLALPLRRDVDAETLRSTLVQGVLRNERAVASHPETNQTLLRDRRVALLEHVRSLRSVRPRWNASPLMAMRELARATALDPAPATTVRLKRSVLDAMPDRAPVAQKLIRAAELGAFSSKTRQGPWYGARLEHRGAAEQAVELVRGLVKDVPPLRAQLESTARSTRIKPVKTFAQWGKTLRLLVDVRHSLDNFEPDIFDKDVDDLIAATAPSAWRREHGIELSSMTRSRLRRVAKEYVRPGVHIEDLHTALTQVQRQRAAWEVLATDRRYPSVPTGLEKVLATFREVLERLHRLQQVLPPVEEGKPALSDLPLAQLQERLEALGASEQDLSTLPERTIVLRDLREQGLGDLVDDLAEREVPAELIPAELDQAWWQSVLEAMISGDDYLALQDGASLAGVQRDFARADAKHVEAGAAEVRYRLSERWRGALADHRVAARDLRALLKIGDPSVGQLAALSPDLTGAVVPIWVGAPLYLPSALPRWARFDATIILDAESLSLLGGLGAIGRSDQVIAIGDPRAGAPRPLSVSVDRGEASHGLPVPLSAFDALSKVTPRRSLTHVYRGMDERVVRALSGQYERGLDTVPQAPGGEVAAGLQIVEGATAAAGSGSAASSRAEVDAVVELVFSQLEEHPERSLAVVAGDAEHARAVATAIGQALPVHPGAEFAFQRAEEPFVVTSVERVNGLRRDAVIFTLGHARTPHGRPVHDLGRLATPAGARGVVAALTAGRSWLRIVAAFKASELDRSRLRHGAGILADVMAALEEDGPAKAAPARSIADDPLLRDLAERLEAGGLRVEARDQDGVDLAVWRPEAVAGAAPAVAGAVAEGAGAAAEGAAAQGRTFRPVAVVSDGTDRYASASVRRRSRVTPQELAARGWDPVQVWTIDVFSDPGRVARGIAARLGVDLRAATSTASAGAAATAGSTASTAAAGLTAEGVSSASSAAGTRAGGAEETGSERDAGH